MFGKLNNTEIEQLIQRQFIGRIGCHADDLTYVVPISYAYDGIFIYGYTYEGLKIDMMRKNPKICFEVDDTRNLANWQSVIAWGEFAELDKEEDRKNALQQLNARALPVISSETMHISPLWPFPNDDADMKAGIVFRIRLTEKTGRYEKSPEKFFYAT